MFKKAKVLYYHNNSNQGINDFYNKIKDLSFQDAINKEEFSLKKMIACLPIGTIVAKSLDVDEDNIICLPGFSSHISLPLKQGEYVWYFTDSIVHEKDVTSKRPLLSIHNYWFSRIHGSLISEDLNYTYIERDAKFSGEFVSQINDALLVPNFESNNMVEAHLKNSKDSKSTLELYKEGNEIYFSSKATPRYFSPSDDLSLQGSYNTLINLSKTYSMSSLNGTADGSINIIAGRSSLQDFYDSEEDIVFKKFIVDGTSVSLDLKDVSINKLKYNKIKNTAKGEELFKKPGFYMHEDQEFNLQESNINFLSDASSLSINELLNIDSDSFYNTTYLNTGFYLDVSDEDGSSVEIESFIATPSILMKTNNIRIVARNELTSKIDSDFVLPEGNIRLIKESDSIINYSHLLLESNGFVDITGNTINIGNFKTEYIKHFEEDYEKFNDQEIAEQFLNEGFKKENLDKMRGTGQGVTIGYDPQLSEPLVLGDTLKSLLEQILETNIEFVNELKKISAALKTHTHNNAIPVSSTIPLLAPSPAGAPVPVPPGTPIGNVISPSQAPTDPSVYNTYETSASSNLENKYNEINKNLINMLSKFAKTS